jgi:hypothetical protein
VVCGGLEDPNLQGLGVVPFGIWVFGEMKLEKAMYTDTLITHVGTFFSSMNK